MNIFQQREQILADLIEAYREHDEEKTNHLLDQLKELDKPAKQKILPEEPKERGYYLAANDDRLFYKDSDDDWSAVDSPLFWNGNCYAKWPEVCAQLPPEAFPLKRVNTGDGDDD